MPKGRLNEKTALGLPSVPRPNGEAQISPRRYPNGPRWGPGIAVAEKHLVSGHS